PAMACVSPMIERTVVVLPMPLRPMSVTTSPGAMASEMPCSTWLKPYVVCTPSSSSRLAMRHRLFVGRTQIGLAHLGIGADRRRHIGRDHAPIDQDSDPVGECEHRLHVVLDQK